MRRLTLLLCALFALALGMSSGLDVPVTQEPDPSCYLDYLRVSEAGCCIDGIDQDADGLIDHRDHDCRGPQWTWASTAEAGWNPQLAVNAGWVAQTTTDASGDEVTEWSPTVLTGIQFWRTGKGFGFSAGAAGLPDEEQRTPRIAPYGAIHFGRAEAQFYVGACYDPQNGGGNDLVGTFGFTAAFGK